MCISIACTQIEDDSAMDSRFDDASDGDGGESSHVKKGLRAALLVEEE